MHWYSAMFASLMAVFAFWLVLAIGPAAASSAGRVTLTSIAQITIDDEGKHLDYPLSVFFDPTEEEIYVVNGVSGRIVVYGPDYFPSISIGEGRGVFSPRGGQVLPNGNVYICQLVTSRSSVPRITVLNGAFFVDKEIPLDEVPDIGHFQPTQLAVSQDGLIYVAGETGDNRGVLVLDDDGRFLRRIQPMDITRIQVEEEEKPVYETENGVQDEEDPYADLPEEFRPREAGSFTRGLGPIRIHYVTLDSTGKIYMISDETSKIYVYGPNEAFLFSFGVKGGSPGQMSRPVSLAIDENIGVIYVADYMRHTILVYDMSGEYLTEFGGRGFGEGWFNYPFEITLDNRGNVIVADLFNKRIQVLNVILLDPIPEKTDTVKTGAEQEEAAPLQQGELTDQEEAEPGQQEEVTDQEVEEQHQIIPEEESPVESVEEAPGGSEEIEAAEPEKEELEEEIIEEIPPAPPAPRGPLDEPLETAD